MAAKVNNDQKDPKTMLAVHVTKWLDVNTVPDKVSFGQIPALPEPKKMK